MFALVLNDTVLDLSSPSAASSVLDLSAPLPPGESPVPPMAVISEVALFTEQVLRNPPLGASPIGAPVPVAPASVWLAVAYFDAAASDAPDAGVLILRLPQFSDPLAGVPGFPPAVPPTAMDPAGLPNSTACGWNRVWNGSQCAWYPIDVPLSNEAAQITDIEVSRSSSPRGDTWGSQLPTGCAGAMAHDAAGCRGDSTLVRVRAVGRGLPWRLAEHGA